MVTKQSDVELVQDVEALFDLPPSNFPCLDASPGASTLWQSTEIPFRNVILLQSFCTQYNVSSFSVWQAAWALVLRCYLGNPSVCFACEVSKGPAGIEKSMLPNMVDGLICKADIEAKVSAIDLLNRMRVIKHNSSSQSARAPLHPSLQFSGCSAPPANTLLLFHEHERQDRLEEQGREGMNWTDRSVLDVRFHSSSCWIDLTCSDSAAGGRRHQSFEKQTACYSAL